MDNLKPDDVFTLDIINEAVEKAKMWPYWCKPSEDGQEDDQAETKEGFKLWDRERTAEILIKHLVPRPDRD